MVLLKIGMYKHFDFNKIQEKVKDALESMTGLSVEKVNVHIDGVNIEKNSDVPAETQEEVQE